MITIKNKKTILVVVVLTKTLNENRNETRKQEL